MKNGLWRIWKIESISVKNNAGAGRGTVPNKDNEYLIISFLNNIKNTISKDNKTLKAIFMKNYLKYRKDNNLTKMDIFSSWDYYKKENNDWIFIHTKILKKIKIQKIILKNIYYNSILKLN